MRHDNTISRGCSKRIPARPPDKARNIRSTAMFHVLLFLVALICVPLLTIAQSATVSTTVNLPDLPLQLTLPPLNSTSPTIQLSLANTSNLFITFDICSLGSNTTLIPTVLVSTASPPSFNFGTRSSLDYGSGGVGKPNRRNRAGTVWRLEWSMGFANWTKTDVDSLPISILIGNGLQIDGTVDESLLEQGNVIVRVGLATDGRFHPPL